MAPPRKASGGFSRASTAQKALVLLLIVVLSSVLYWLILLRPLASELSTEEEIEMRLNGEERTWATKQQSYQRDKETLVAQQTREREQVKILPNEANMDSFLDQLNGLAELAGLELESTTPADEEPAVFYARVPVALRVSGRYHQIAKFFYNVSRLDRIINMENIEISSPDQTSGEVIVEANVLATTFRALAPAAAGSGAPGEAPAPGATP